MGLGIGNNSQEEEEFANPHRKGKEGPLERRPDWHRLRQTEVRKAKLLIFI